MMDGHRLFGVDEWTNQATPSFIKKMASDRARLYYEYIKARNLTTDEYQRIDLTDLAVKLNIKPLDFIEALGFNRTEYKLVTSFEHSGKLYTARGGVDVLDYGSSEVADEVLTILIRLFPDLDFEQIDDGLSSSLCFAGDDAWMLFKILEGLTVEDEETISTTESELTFDEDVVWREEVNVDVLDYEERPREPKLTSARSTPAAAWRENSEDDPHGTIYDCERAELCLGNYTDDSLANLVFMRGNVSPTVSDMFNNEPTPIVILTAAKDRIRWLSRKLEEALAEKAKWSIPAPAALPATIQYDDQLVKIIVRWMGYDKPTVIKLRQIVMKEYLSIPDWMEHILTLSCDQWSEVAPSSLRATLLYRAMQEPLKLPVINHIPQE